MRKLILMGLLIWPFGSSWGQRAGSLSIAQDQQATALALRPLFFHNPDPEIFREVQEIKDFLQKVHPGSEVKILPPDEENNDPHFERVPFTYRNHTLWIRRHHIYDSGESA